VRGISVGDAQLEVLIGGRERQAPTFTLKVVEPQTFKITAWIVSNDKQKPARQIEDVQAMIAPLNDIYRQVGVSFYLDSITVTNIPDAYNALYDEPSSPTSTWTFDDIVGISSGTGGLECYFIKQFVDSADTLAANSSSGMVVACDADYLVVAHEIGHAFGMRDIYSSNEKDKSADDPLISLNSGDLASYTHMMDDWSGGCDGHGAGGARYYESGALMTEILSRMLMNGLRGSNDNARDITAGMVYGVYYSLDASGRKVWRKDDAAVDFPWASANPIHR